MHLPKPTEGGDFTPVPEGTFPATCYRFIDLGTQAGEYMGASKIARKVMLSWEITDPETRMEDGKPFTISSRFTWSMHEKSTLRKTLEKLADEKTHLMETMPHTGGLAYWLATRSIRKGQNKHEVDI